MELPDAPPEARTQSGRFSYAQARAAGWSAQRLETAVRKHLLTRPVRGVYAAADVELGDPVSRQAALLREVQLPSGRRTAGARRTAALLHGLPLIGQAPERAQTLRDRGSKDAHGRDRHARVGLLPSAHVVEVEGLLLTTVARTVVDISRQESFRNAVVVADGAFADTPPEEAEALLLTMRRWPGAAHARTAIAFADGRAESPGESLTRVAMHREGLPAAEPQVEVWRYGRFIARVDLLLREALLAVEFDGAFKFDGTGVLPALVARQEELRSCGIDVLRTDWDEVFRDTDRFGARVRQRLAERSAPRLAAGVELRSTLPRWQRDLDAA